MSRRIVINPITRLEGHGSIEILLDETGAVQRAFFQAPDFRGFEAFCLGRAAEEMPVLTAKICGICPTAHHIAAAKALDLVFNAPPPPAAHKIRELMLHAYLYEDHLLHFYYLGGPDLMVGPEDAPHLPTIFGVIRKMGADIVTQVMAVRKKVRHIHSLICGSAAYPVNGLPGGVSKALASEHVALIRAIADEAVGMARFSLDLFLELLHNDRSLKELMRHDAFYLPTCYMGMVDDDNRVGFYDGMIRVVGPDGREIHRFAAADYALHLEERIDPLSRVKPVFLRSTPDEITMDAPQGGLYRVGPLARLNAADAMATPLAQAAFIRMFDVLGEKPAHHTLAYHWARLIETVYAAERLAELADDPRLTDPRVRTMPNKTAGHGVGAIEAPRGTLFHEFTTDNQALIQQVNLLVATQNNAAAIGASLEKAARAFVKADGLTPAVRRMINMAWRAYDPCLACAAH